MNMSIQDVGDVLGDAAAFDLRIVGKADTLAWYRVIGHLDAKEARDAVLAHYTDTNERIMPGDVLRRVADAHRRNTIVEPGAGAVAYELEIPDADPNDIRAYQASLRAGRRRAAAPDARRRPVPELLAGFGAPEDPAAAADRKASWGEYFDVPRVDTTRRRELVLAHPDLAAALTSQVIGYQRPEQWNGYIPPETDAIGRLDNSPRRMALIALAGEAERRAA